MVKKSPKIRNKRGRIGNICRIHHPTFGIATFIWLMAWPHLAIAQKNREPSNITSEAAKHLSSAYNSFYHRHDSAGCVHIGLAFQHLSSLKMTSDESSQIKERLEIAKHFCTEDKTPRVVVIKAIRETLKILNGHSLATND